MSAVIPETTDLSKYVEIRPYGEMLRPFIRGRRLPVSFIGKDYTDRHQSIAEIAYNYTINEAEVVAGILYYLEHKDEVEALEEEVNQFYRPMFEDGRKRWEEMKARRTEKTEQP